MTTEIGDKLYTVEEFLGLDLPDDEEYELIGGRVVARSKGSPSGEHGRVIFKIAGQMGVYLDKNPVGEGYTEAACTLGRPEGADYVRPDVCFVTSGRTPPRFRGPIPVAPDLAVEVWSPTDDTETIQNKLDAYKEAGVRLVWSVYLLNRYVLVYRLDDPGIKLLNLGDELEGEDVLPGFRMPIKVFFD